jgi:hypothetical protein
MLCMLIIAKNVCFFNMFIFVILMAGLDMYIYRQPFNFADRNNVISMFSISID